MERYILDVDIKKGELNLKNMKRKREEEHEALEKKRAKMGILSVLCEIDN